MVDFTGLWNWVASLVPLHILVQTIKYLRDCVSIFQNLTGQSVGIFFCVGVKLYRTVYDLLSVIFLYNYCIDIGLVYRLKRFI